MVVRAEDARAQKRRVVSREVVLGLGDAQLALGHHEFGAALRQAGVGALVDREDVVDDQAGFYLGHSARGAVDYGV